MCKKAGRPSGRSAFYCVLWSGGTGRQKTGRPIGRPAWQGFLITPRLFATHGFTSIRAGMRRASPTPLALTPLHPCCSQQLGRLAQVEESLQAGVLSHVASSSQTPYPSPRRQRQGLLSPVLLLSPRDPLRWARAGAPSFWRNWAIKNGPPDRAARLVKLFHYFRLKKAFRPGY